LVKSRLDASVTGKVPAWPATTLVEPMLTTKSARELCRRDVRLRSTVKFRQVPDEVPDKGQ
jgi:hypothetical protein